MTVAPESTANRAPSANAFPEVMNESPTLMGSTMQFGQAPTSWDEGAGRAGGVLGRAGAVVVVHVVVGVVVVVDEVPAGDGVGEAGRPGAGRVVRAPRGPEGGDQVSRGDAGVARSRRRRCVAQK